MTNRNQTRRENYKKLRAAGFTSQEADRVKGAKPGYINQVLRAGRLPPVDPVKRAAGYKQTKASIDPGILQSYQYNLKKWQRKIPKLPKIPKYNIIGEIPKPMVGKIKYTVVGKETFNYQSNYSYVMAFQVKHLDETREWKYITLVSSEPVKKKDLIIELRRDILENYENMTKYSTIPLVSTIVLTEAYRRDDA